MPPKRKTDAGVAVKRASKKVYGKAPELPEGELLTDFSKKQWRLGRSIGSGGFGRIYIASKVGEKAAQFVVKMEPANNGPLFQEIHFYQRVGKEEMLREWKKQKGLKYLGIPPFIAAGLHVNNGVEFRFLLMPRLGNDLEKHRSSVPGGRLDPSFVFRLTLCCLDSLEYLHYSAQYVHADVKGENLLSASEKSVGNGEQFYLVDYGLARKVAHTPVYKEAPKKAHDGTLIFTSLDAHRGCTPSYRGDVEILGYNIIYWISGTLPWINAQQNPEKVRDAKETFSKHCINELTRSNYLSPFSKELGKYYEHVYSLDYDDRPNFDLLRKTIRDAIAKVKTSGRSVEMSSTSSSSRTTIITTNKNGTPKAKSQQKRQKSSSVATASNGIGRSGKVIPLLQNFQNSHDSSTASTDDDEDSVAVDDLRRPGNKQKIILAVDTPSPLVASPKKSPRSIIPGKMNLRRYDAHAAAKRRSSIMVKKKYLAPKKSTAVSTSTRTTRSAKIKKAARISSSSSSEEDGQ